MVYLSDFNGLISSLVGWYCRLGIHLSPKDLRTNEQRAFSSHVPDKQTGKQTARFQGIPLQEWMYLRAKLHSEIRLRSSSVSMSLHSMDDIDCDGDGWRAPTKRRKHLPTVPLERDVVSRREHLPQAHLSNSRDRPCLKRPENLNVSARCIFPSSMGKFDHPILSLVNAEPLDSKLQARPSEEPIPGTPRFGIPIPPKKVRLWGADQDAQSLLRFMLNKNLRSRRLAFNSVSTDTSRPSPMIAGASDPISPNSSG